MNKITVTNKETGYKSASTFPVGTIFVREYSGDHCLRTFTGAVYLATGKEASVYDYGKPLSEDDKVTITIGKQEVLPEVLTGVILPEYTLVLVRDLLQDGKKIDAIKLVRSESMLGLKEAKDYVDNFYTLNPQFV